MIMSLLEFVISAIYFQFDGEYYHRSTEHPCGALSSDGIRHYMDDLEDEAMDTAPQDTRASMWRWYINDSFEVVKRDK